MSTLDTRDGIIIIIITSSSTDACVPRSTYQVLMSLNTTSRISHTDVTQHYHYFLADGRKGAALPRRDLDRREAHLQHERVSRARLQFTGLFDRALFLVVGLL